MAARRSSRRPEPRATRRARLGLLGLLPLLTLMGCSPSATPLPTAAPPTPTPTLAVTSSPAPTHTPAPTLALAPALGLVRLWRAATDDTVWAIGQTDLQRDGRPEFWAASNDHRFYLLTASGEISWSYSTAAPLYAALAGDLEGDGQPEFLLGGDDNAVHTLSGDGTLRWSYHAGGRVTHLAAGDLDGDRQAEVIAATWDRALHVLDAAGEQRLRLALEGMPSALAVADLDSDEALEVLVGLESGKLLAFEGSGRALWEHGLEGPVRGLVVDDLDGDGDQEVAVGSRSGLVALIGTDGTPRWAQRLEGTVVSLVGLPQAGLILVGKAGGITALQATDGLAAWDLPTRHGVWTMAPLEDGTETTMAAGTDGGEIVLFNPQGQIRGSTQLPSRVHGLLGADLDRDGRPELVARSGDYLYAFVTADEGEPGESAPSRPTLPRWATPSPLPPLPEDRIALVLVGDIMLSRSIEERMRAYDSSYPFQPFAPLLQQAEITVGNLECVLSLGGEPATKPYVFRAHPDMAAGLAWAGFDVVSLANSHALDYGSAGLAETIAALEGQGISAVGAGYRAAEPVVVERNGIRVAFLARDATGLPQTGIAVVQDEQTLRQDVGRAASAADVVVVLLNAGSDYGPETTPEQRLLARAAVEAGADLVICNHRYAVEETEQLGRGFVAYGLGNFVFDIDIEDIARDGAALRAVLSKKGIVRVDRIATRIVDDVKPHPLAAPGGRVAVQTLFVETSEPLPPPPSPRATYVLSATVNPAAGRVEVRQTVGFPNTTGDRLEDLVFFVFPDSYPGCFALQEIQVLYKGQRSTPSYTLSQTNLRLFLPLPLAQNEIATVTMSYSLSLPLLDPLAWPPEGNLGHREDGRAIQLGHWYPQLVPYRRGYGWQTWVYHPVGDPFVADLADYRVTVTAPGGYLVFGSGERQQDGERWFFQIDAVRDFAALIGRDYLETTGQADGVQVISAYRREHGLAGQGVLNDVVQAIALFQELYGPYPYRNFTVVEGDMNGGMEYGAFALVGSPFYHVFGGEPTAILPSLAVHELAHQWWYGVVGNNQVNEPWLDEAVVRYSELLYYERTYPESVDWWWQNRIDQWNPSGPLDAAIYDYADTASYVHNLYGQGAHFMQDLRTRVGDPAFIRFLRRYYRESAWQRVTRRDFFRILEEETGQTLDDLILAYFRP